MPTCKGCHKDRQLDAFSINPKTGERFKLCDKCREYRREYYREYVKRPEYKEYRREYQREYVKRPEYKEYQREYAMRPEVKEKQRRRAGEHWRKYHEENGASADEIMRCYLEHPNTFHKDIMPITLIRKMAHARGGQKAAFSRMTTKEQKAAWGE